MKISQETFVVVIYTACALMACVHVRKVKYILLCAFFIRVHTGC